MNINTELYKVFSAVAAAGTFSGAAKALSISQPAVSQAIIKLEEALDVRLFNRSSRGVSLTKEGELLSGYVRSAMGLIEAGEERLSQLSSLSAGELRIGASDTVSKWYLSPYIGKYHTLYPDVKISITNRTTDGTMALLRDGSLDIGFVNMPVSEMGFVFEECLPVHDIFIAGEPFSHLKGKPLSLSELASYPLIMLEQASNSRRMVDRHFLSNGVVLQPEIELGAHDLMTDYARIGLGIACVTREFVSYTDHEGLFEVELTQKIPRRSVAVCYRENIPLSAAAKRFISLLGDEDNK